MRILVLGGSGFFGKSFLDYFQNYIFKEKSSPELILASRNISSINHLVNPKYLNKKLFLEDIDVTSCSSIPECDLVIHAATTTTINDYINNPDLERNNIIAGAENIIKKINKDMSFIYVSSGAVYGKQLSVNNCYKEDEKNKFIDLNGVKLLYANAKIEAENTVIKYSKINSTNSAIARCYAFVGRHLPLDTHFYVGNMINSILMKNKFEIKAKNPVFRSYMHSDDLVRSLLFIKDYTSINSEIFNIGSNDVVELHELAKFFSSEYKFKISGNEESNKNIKPDIYIPNIDKILSKGFKLNYNTYNSIKNVIELLNNKKND